MRPSSIKHYIKEGFKGLIRNRLMTVASVATVAACIFLIVFSYCIVSNLQHIFSQIEDSIGTVAFLEIDLDSERINEISEEIKNIDHVSLVTYVSSDEALDSFKEDWGVAGILDGFDSENNPLSGSFDISLEKLEYQGEVVRQLEIIDGIRVVLNAEEETEILLETSNTLRNTSIIFIFVLSVVSVVIIMNTIKVSVYTRRNEINIMKFVGATDWFIRWPFAVEGVLIGLIGALIPMIVSWPMYEKAIEILYDKVPMLQNLVSFRHPVDIFYVLFPVCLLAGIALGVIGSIYSMRKHLKV